MGEGTIGSDTGRRGCQRGFEEGAVGRYPHHPALHGHLDIDDRIPQLLDIPHLPFYLKAVGYRRRKGCPPRTASGEQHQRRQCKCKKSFHTFSNHKAIIRSTPPAAMPLSDRRHPQQYDEATLTDAAPAGDSSCTTKHAATHSRARLSVGRNRTRRSPAERTARHWRTGSPR